MSTSKRRRHLYAKTTTVLHKPRGSFHPRVQAVGPQHFGIVSVDCGKRRCKWMLADFYGTVLVPPTWVQLDRPQLDAMIGQLRQAIAEHQLHDVVVAIERTGRYHHPVQHALSAAGFDTRIVHPFVTHRQRQAASPDVKTDDVDLAAIFRGAALGFALLEPPLDLPAQTLRLLVRHRRDLVRKCSTLACQIREHLEAVWPGFADCFESFWDSQVAWYLVREFATPAELVAAGRTGLAERLHHARIRFQQRTLDKVLLWANDAAAADLAAEWHRRIALVLVQDRQRKTQEIQALEQELASAIVHTPYVLLLSFPGLNVASTAEFAGEMGPITHYANSRTITGRAGLRPSRYQSDQVDRANGRLARCANRRLRFAILTIAANLISNNHYFNALSLRWTAQGKDPRHTRVRVGQRFVRIAFQMVAGRRLFHHPGLQERHYILHKLTAFHSDHATPSLRCLSDLQAAIEQLPRPAYAEEAKPLQEELERLHSRRRGPQALADVLPIVLARLGAPGIQSGTSGEHDAD
jgi:transposase